LLFCPENGLLYHYRNNIDNLRNFYGCWQRLCVDKYQHYNLSCWDQEVFAFFGVERGFLQLFFYLSQNCRDFQELPLLNCQAGFLWEIYEKFKIFLFFP
jgi:hypothetical protein